MIISEELHGLVQVLRCVVVRTAQGGAFAYNLYRSSTIAVDANLATVSIVTRATNLLAGYGGQLRLGVHHS